MVYEYISELKVFMYLFFIDESQNPPKKAKRFILAGIIIPANEWFSVDEKFNSIKLKYNISGEIKWRYFSMQNTDPKNPFLHLNKEDREKFKLEMYNIIKDNPNLIIIGSVSNIKDLPNLSNEELYHKAYKVIAERFQYFIQSKDTENKKEYGIIVADNRCKQEDDRLKDYHNINMKKTAIKHKTNFRSIIENLFIANSHFSTGLQFAEIVCGAISRYFNADDNAYYKIVRDNIRKSETGEIKGYGIIPIPKDAKLTWINKDAVSKN